MHPNPRQVTYYFNHRKTPELSAIHTPFSELFPAKVGFLLVPKRFDCARQWIPTRNEERPMTRNQLKQINTDGIRNSAYVGAEDSENFPFLNIILSLSLLLLPRSRSLLTLLFGPSLNDGGEVRPQFWRLQRRTNRASNMSSTAAPAFCQVFDVFDRSTREARNDRGGRRRRGRRKMGIGGSEEMGKEEIGRELRKRSDPEDILEHE